MPLSFTFTISTPATTPVVPGSDPAVTAGAEALRDKALDQLTGDLQSLNGDQVYVADIAGIASDLASNWRFVKGEYFLNLTKGVDYWGVIFKKGSTLEACEEEFRREGIATKGVAALTLKLTKTGRTLNVEAAVRADTGQIFNASFGATQGS